MEDNKDIMDIEAQDIEAQDVDASDDAPKGKYGALTSAEEDSRRLTGMYKNWFLDYASYVILERAVPHLADGLKPVQRRILHAMKCVEDGRFNKVANVVGQAMQYHPHGDASIKDALVQLGQKGLLIDMQGNWGNILTGDEAAAARYIEARLSKFALDVVYNKKTTDMLMLVPQSYANNGFGQRWDNVGAMVNRGVELSANLDIIRTENFVWNINGNASYNHNEITELYNGLDEYEMSGTSTKLVVGHPVGEFYINRYAGVNPANGDALWYDKEGNITNVLRDEDKVMIGKTYHAPWQGGFGTSLSWKGLNLSAQFSWVGDRWMLNNDRYFDESNGRFMTYNQSSRLLKRWKQPGDITDIPRHGVYTEFDSRLLEDASFLRLKNLMLSYNLPSGLLKKTGFIRGLRVYAQGQNLLTFTNFSGLDPEGVNNVYAAQYPMSRQYTFGLDLMF